MKILALAPFVNTGRDQTARRVNQRTREQILKMLGSSNAQLIVLPGYCKDITPSPEQLQGVLAAGSVAFVEGPGSKGSKCGWPYLVTPKTIIRMPKQCFAQEPKRKDIEAFCSAIPCRTHEIAGHRFVFVLCGEITGFERDGTLKYGMAAPEGIVINPAHTPMGRWGVLGKKLEALSSGSLAVHVANNTSKHPSGSKTDVRIYRDSKHVKRQSSDDRLAWCECVI